MLNVSLVFSTKTFVLQSQNCKSHTSLKRPMRPGAYLTKINLDKLTVKQTQKIIDAITVYWNFFTPAFPDGRTPAEAKGMEATAWMQPLLTKHKEKLDKLAVRIHFVDRINEITEQTLSELRKGLSTPRTQAIIEIMQALEKHGAPEQGLKKTLQRSGPPSKKPSEPAIIIPFVSLYAARNVKKVRRILREYSRRESTTQEGSCNLKEDPGGNSFAVYQWTGTIGVRLGTIDFLPDSRLFVGSLTSTRRNALHKFLTELMKGDLMLLEELRDVELPPL